MYIYAFLSGSKVYYHFYFMKSEQSHNFNLIVYSPLVTTSPQGYS